MMRVFCKSKLHKVRVTAIELDYDGSIELDPALMEAADISPWEQVQVLNLENGARLITYAIPGERGSGTVALKGPAARAAVIGDRIIVISYVYATPEEWSDKKPITVTVDEKNKIKKVTGK